MHNEITNPEKEKSFSNKSNDNSYTVIDNELYYSSPKKGIKSKLNNKNKNHEITPFTSTTENRATYFTFNVFREASADFGSKEDNINSQKSSNIISEFSISNIKNSKLDNTNINNSKLLITDKDEKERVKMIDIISSIKEENENEVHERKHKDNNNNIKLKKYLSSDLDSNKKTKSQRSYLNNMENNKTKEKGDKKKSYKYSVIGKDEEINKKENDIKIFDEVKRYTSVNYVFDTKKKKKTFKGHCCENNFDLEIKILKDIKDRIKNNKEKNLKNKKYKNINENNNINNDKMKFAKNLFHHPLIHTDKNLHFSEFGENRLKLLKKTKKSKNPYNSNTNNNISNNEKEEDRNNLNNFEDNNYISHPIQIKEKEKEKDEAYCFLIKSTKFLSKRTFSLLKEVDRDYAKQITRDIKCAKKNSKNSKKKKKKIRNNTIKQNRLKLTDKKTSKKISDFCDSSKRLKKEMNNKDLALNFFRKCSKNENNNNNNIYRYRSEKSTEYITSFDINKKESKERQYKLKSPVTLVKNLFNKKSIENKKGSHYKRNIKRRHTTHVVNDKKNKYKINKNTNKENDDFYLNYGHVNGYDDDCSSKNESMDEKAIKMKMKIDKITEDKLILNYQNKNEIIELLSDKENINNYYEYLDICLETIQEMNLKEVPKSKAKIDFKFPDDRKNKKIALFDLDETLVHCIGEINKNNKDDPMFAEAHKIKVILPCKKEVTIGINVRPHLKKLFDKIKDEYNIVIFTASHQSYSDAVLNYLDPKDQYFHYRLYRDSCVQYRKNDINFYVKDLDIFKDKYDLKDIIIIDNSILSFAYHFNNGIPVVPFYDSKQDNELPLLCFYLLSIASYKDLREANKEHIKLEFILSQAKKDISLDEGTPLHDNLSLNDNKNEKSKINNNSSKNINNNEKGESNNDIKLNETELNDDKQEELNYNRSAKKLCYEIIEAKNINNRRKFNTVKLESYKILDFFEKWKNAYLQRALKK